MDNLIPPKGDPKTIIDRLIDYVAPFDPGLPHRMRGAPIDMIMLYAKLAGFSESLSDLPMSYQMFLRKMGLDDGGLLKNYRIQARLPSIIRLYEDSLRSEPDILNPNLPIVATYIVGDQISFDRSTRLPEPEVVETSDGELIATFSHSWEYLLMQLAILQVEPLRLPIGRWFSSSPRSAAEALPRDQMGKQSLSEAVNSLAEHLELEIAWPSDLNHRIAINNESSLFAKIGTQNQIMLYAFSFNQYVLRQIEDYALQTFGATGGILHLVNGELQNRKS